MPRAAPGCSLNVQCGGWGGERQVRVNCVLVELGFKVHSFTESISHPELLLEHYYVISKHCLGISFSTMKKREKNPH